MSLSNPYPLAFLNDKLPVERVRFSVQRNDELSGSGDGRIWQSELAPPLWTASISLHNVTEACARILQARIDALEGARLSFLLTDPKAAYPALDPGGVILGASAVRLAVVSSDRREISLSGLPAGYVMTAGDKFTVLYADKVYLGQCSDGATATAAGVIAGLPIFPALPFSVTVGASVLFKRPYMRAIVQPEGWVPWAVKPGFTGSGASLDVIQKL